MSIVEDTEKKARREEMRKKMKLFRSTDIIRAVPYEEGMEDGFIDRYYNDEDVEDDGTIHTSGIIGEHKIEVPYIEDNGRYVYVGQDYVVVEKEYSDGRTEISSLDKKEFEKRYVLDDCPLMILDTETNEITNVELPPFNSFVKGFFVCPIDDKELSLKSMSTDDEKAYVIGKCESCNSVWKFSIATEEINEETKEINDAQEP